PSDGSEFTGFHLSIRVCCMVGVACAECGETLQESAGTFSSPDYDYFQNAFAQAPGAPGGDAAQSAARAAALSSEHTGYKCQWRISGTHGERILLNLTALELPASPGCTGDYVELHDGHYHLSPLIGTHPHILASPLCLAIGVCGVAMTPLVWEWGGG